MSVDEVVAGREMGVVPAAREVVLHATKALDLRTFTPHGISAWGRTVGRGG